MVRLPIKMVVKTVMRPIDHFTIALTKVQHFTIYFATRLHFPTNLNVAKGIPQLSLYFLVIAMIGSKPN